MQGVLRAIDNMNEWAGRVVAWFLIPMVFITVFEVVMRYVFNMPTWWAWDLNRQLQGAVVVLGIGYALLHDSHVRVDVLVSRISQKKRLLVEVIAYPVIIAFLVLLIYRLIPYAWLSVKVLEDYTSAWNPPIYPLKVLMLLGFVALTLQAVVIWIRDLIGLISPEKVGNRWMLD